MSVRIIRRNGSLDKITKETETETFAVPKDEQIIPTPPPLTPEQEKVKKFIIAAFGLIDTDTPEFRALSFDDQTAITNPVWPDDIELIIRINSVKHLVIEQNGYDGWLVNAERNRIRLARINTEPSNSVHLFNQISLLISVAQAFNVLTPEMMLKANELISQRLPSVSIMNAPIRRTKLRFNNQNGQLQIAAFDGESGGFFLPTGEPVESSWGTEVTI